MVRYQPEPVPGPGCPILARAHLARSALPGLRAGEDTGADVADFVLIPGAGGSAWYWHLVAAALQDHGHQVTAVALPGADESAGLPEYARLTEVAIGGRRDVVLVSQSMGGFTAAAVAAQVPVRLLVLVNPMIPSPGETPGDWWEHTGWEAARTAAAKAGGYPAEFGLDSYFLHDIPPGLAAIMAEHDFPEAGVAFGQPCAIDRWPDAATRILVGREDRFFPLDFQRRVARDRLGLAVDEIPGGHLAALSQPAALTDALTGYLDQPA
jgi:pimeloyl-ACP methyl ester carboxylesterase